MSMGNPHSTATFVKKPKWDFLKIVKISLPPGKLDNLGLLKMGLGKLSLSL